MPINQLMSPILEYTSGKSLVINCVTKTIACMRRLNSNIIHSLCFIFHSNSSNSYIFSTFFSLDKNEKNKCDNRIKMSWIFCSTVKATFLQKSSKIFSNGCISPFLIDLMTSTFSKTDNFQRYVTIDSKLFTYLFIFTKWTGKLFPFFQISDNVIRGKKSRIHYVLWCQFIPNVQSKDYY